MTYHYFIGQNAPASGGAHSRRKPHSGEANPRRSPAAATVLKRALVAALACMVFGSLGGRLELRAAGDGAANLETDVENGGAAAADAPAVAEPLGDPNDLPWAGGGPKASNGPRELLEKMGIDESHLRSLMDNRPLHADEMEAVNLLLYRMPYFDLESVERWALRGIDLDELALRSEYYRNQFVPLSGTVVSLAIERLVPELVELYHFEEYYRLEMRPRGFPHTVTLIARSVPQAWLKKLERGEPFEEPASAWGMFIKVGEVSGEHPELLFVCQRVAWHPDAADEKSGVTPEQAFLARRGFNVGLFDDVRDGQKLLSTERECFYRLLDMAGAVPQSEFDRLSRGPLDAIVAIRRASDFRGQVFTVSGVARRANLIRVTDPDIVQRMGIHQYYEIEIFVTLDARLTIHYGKDKDESTARKFTTYPVVLCCRSVPSGFPLGDKIHENVEASGMMMKTWAYYSRYVSGGDDEQTDARTPRQSSPLLVAREPTWFPREKPQFDAFTGTIILAVFVLGLLGLWMGVWIYGRGDAKFHRTMMDEQYKLPENFDANALAELDKGPPGEDNGGG